ncbi:hypothetical protein [Cystobacter fuscus]|nr:hypothetical protein [Cystobacter fuscus]
MAANPDAGTMALPEPLQSVASCSLPFRLGEAERQTAKFVEVGGERAVRVQEASESWGTTGLVASREWLVIPGTCRHMALSLLCGAGSPECSARILHRPEQPPTDTERVTLRSWLGGDPLDARRPEHQSASVGRLEQLPPPSEDTATSITARAVTQPPPNWLPGPPVSQTRSWSESDTLEEPYALDEGPRGFVVSGRVYSLHRGDCCVRPKEVRTWGSARLHVFSTGGKWTVQRTYVVLEQPKRGRSQWLFTAGPGLRVLGVHQGRAWLEEPVFMDPGFSLVAIELDTGAVWHLALDASPTFEPDEYRADRVTPQGLLLKSVEGGRREPKLVSWAPLERALREAKPPTR